LESLKNRAPYKRLLINYTIISFLLLLNYSCEKKPESVGKLTERFLILNSLHSIPANNPITIKKVMLGKKLFFDPLLSKNKNLSCASCHDPKLAFSDGVALSNIGTTKKTLNRNSPALFNLAWHTDFFWDGGKTSLENQAFGPLRNEHEMAMNLDSLLVRLNNDSAYRDSFTGAFDDGLKIENVVKAIASYERTLMSFSSKYDQYTKGELSLSKDELAGEKVFFSNCSSCHRPPLFTDTKFHNNGLDNNFPEEFINPSQGHYRVTGKIKDQGHYKTPSLRNLSFTSPYMHDGRLSSLEDVLTHYESPKRSHSLDTLLTKGIKLSAQEKKELLIFLNTLNDYNFVNQ
jgi:cytochrome c peroxidase